MTEQESKAPHVGSTENKPGWEQEVLNRLAFASLNEQRRARRWGIFFKTLTFAYLFVLLYLLMAGDSAGPAIKAGQHTALVEVKGLIADSTDANADTIVRGLRNAFEDRDTAGVILRINSPGGSPVQAGYVYDEILRLRQAYPEIPVYTVVSDMCASGGYYIAAASDAIYANRASVVGSIGVLMNGFGFVEAMDKLGVERRLMTAGEHKGMLDPFSPSNKADQAHMQSLLDTIHQQFISAVKNGRGERLADDPRIFSGLFWTGEEGVELGLVDGLGSTGYVAREVIGAEKIVDFTPRKDYFERFTQRLGSSMAGTLAELAGVGGSGEARLR